MKSRMPPNLDAARAEVSHLREALRFYEQKIEELDEAMAPAERIEFDIRWKGGFVSGLNVFETGEQIIDRAIAGIKEARRLNAGLDAVLKAQENS